jgi:hypothetical protein
MPKIDPQLSEMSLNGAQRSEESLFAVLIITTLLV